MELIQSKYQIPPLRVKTELKGLIISAVSFLIFPYLIRMLDSSAAAIDPGVLSGIILAIASVLLFQAITWWVIKVIWPDFAMYSREQFARNFKSLSASHKVIIYLFFYLALLYAFIGVLAQLL